MDPFAPFLASRRGLCLVDGGLGTYIEQHIAEKDASLWSASLLTTSSGVRKIQEAHRAFYRAGADLVLTATYQASLEGFRTAGYTESDAKRFIQEAVLVANETREAFWQELVENGNGKRRLRPLVAVSLGCYGAYLADGSEFTGEYCKQISARSLMDFHLSRVRALNEIEQSAFEIFAFETIPCLKEVDVCLKVVQELKKPAWISLSLKDDAHLCSGETLDSAITAITRDRPSNLIAIGINCTSPFHVETAIKGIKQIIGDSLHLVAYPNSGEKWCHEKMRWIDGSSIDCDVFLSLARKWVNAGALIIGGCCKITPEYISYLADNLHRDESLASIHPPESTFPILALGPNPALQKFTVFEELRINEVNRALDLTILVGGKGQNFATAACQVKPKSCAVAHFLGGGSGKWIYKGLSGSKIPQVVTWIDSQTRTCTTLKDLKNGTVTELIDPSARISTNEKQNFLNQLKIHFSHVKAISLCGTCPPGCENLYSEVAEMKPNSCLLLLDSFKNVERTLKTNKVDILKIALYELRVLVGQQEGGVDSLCIALFTKYRGIAWLAITDGPNDAFLFHHSKGDETKTVTTKWQYILPSIPEDRILNPIGAGDTCGGVLLAKHVVEEIPIEIAFKYGLAAATAKCMVVAGGGNFSKPAAEKIFSSIEMKLSYT